MSNFRSRSREEFNGAQTTVEIINAGSLQRIADACEKMTVNWNALASDRDRYQRWYEQERAKVASRDLRIRALHGAVTKAKRRAEPRP